ncbi:exodeoxyribonuclease V beta subunit [Friedmanniella endophytica]|uniref:RecBCD enzyme subunit RecB n=1 Tax=Microlunatus kandeliicorticis TaxID=1759536 RepID=A0A7W3IUR0_9ACTN|nr:UvrD-helicase domain-containing protein [Microlunatus kandeliicorticis]MBA8795633.1 exodeoxyribonuclease V beta subunit [Microlunatus kandeliicorticis]
MSTTTRSSAGRTDEATRTAFDPAGPLPTGTTVLEASAGTGKTWTIAALATRFVAEGRVTLSEIMLVTFGRMATDELRQRVRERLAGTERALAAVLLDDGSDTDGGGGPSGPDADDPVVRLLADGPREAVAARHARLRAALADFDAATIATTHEFCQTMLAGLGVLGDADADAVFVETLTDLTRQVTAEVYLRRFAAGGRPPFTLEEAQKLAAAVVAGGTARLVPEPGPTPGGAGPDLTDAGQRVAFAREVREEVTRRKQRGRIYGYDDMLTRLQACLADPDSGERAAARLRDRFGLVLVDEFQDTDPIQWDILRRAFHGHVTLVLIGDPKQAIYAFRGADVYSYLDAVGQADTVATLDTNWRSDAPLLAALDELTGGAALGDERIVVRPVEAGRPDPRIRRTPGTGEATGAHEAPVRIRVREQSPTEQDKPPISQLRREVAADLAADVVALLDQGVEILDDDRRWRRLGPGDIAVLVRYNKQLEPIRTALAGLGVPAVVRGAGSVFDSDAAVDWTRLLTACENPRQPSIRAVALTAFVGWDLADLAAADEDAVTRLTTLVRRWARILTRQGVAAMLAAITEETGLAGRILAEPDGERRLTDLRHVGESLHAAMTGGQLGTGALLAWLAERVEEARRAGTDELSRRLETDTAAVQILTIHRSKGLEFPVVYLPEASDRWVPDEDGQVLRLHDDDAPGAGGSDDGRSATGLRSGTALDVGGRNAPGRRDRLSRYWREDAGEDLRLYYVALTRARSLVVTWWLPSHNTATSALQRFWARSRVPGAAAVPEARYPAAGTPAGLRAFDPALIAVETVPAPGTRAPATWDRPAPVHTDLDVRRFDRPLDLAWRRTSYSALTGAVHGVVVAAAVGGGVGSEPDGGKEDDESPVAETLSQTLAPTVTPTVGGSGPAASTSAMVSPMTDLPMGTQFGTAVHAVLEAVDPAASQAADRLVGDLTAAAAVELARGPSGELTAGTLGPALAPALLTPLGPLAGDRRLVDLPATDRLAELTFELPLAGGDTPHGTVRLGDLVPLLERHLGPDDLLHRYPDRLRLPLLADQPLRGYLTGSIDAVLRVTDGGVTRYLVADYKTNWLGDPDVRPLPVDHYAPTAMAEAMIGADYPLQALLYAVALHRYLRWRHRGYEPAAQLGGVLYLFLRGMAGPDTPRASGQAPYGVFSWRPPAALVTELSDLLDGRS